MKKFYYISITKPSIRIDKDGTTLIRYAAGKKNTSFVIPSTVTYIDDSAFAGCTSLKSIEIPDNVVTVGDGAFFNKIEKRIIANP